MVQAILEGRKTQTRRVVNPQPTYSENCGFNWKGYVYGIGSDYAETVSNFTNSNCPFGKVGERLWVRETWHVEPGVTGWSMDDNEPCIGWIEYKAGGSKEVVAPNFDAVQRCFPKGEVDWDFLPYDWRPSIFMPRWACRLILEITKIRVERLNDISEADCVKEGIGSALLRDCKRPKFMQLWESINGAGSWNENPWVWVVEFKVLKGK